MIYFIQSGSDGPIKIGTSDDPLARIAQLQGANPRRLRFIGCGLGWPESEAGLLRQFAHLRTAGGAEWFEPAPELLECIADITRRDLPNDLKRAWDENPEVALEAMLEYWTYQEKLDDWWLKKWGCQLRLWSDIRPVWMRSYDGDMGKSHRSEDEQ